MIVYSQKDVERLIYLTRETRSWQKKYQELSGKLPRDHADLKKALNSLRHFEDQTDTLIEKLNLQR